MKVNEEGKEFELNGTVYHEGDYISLDGSTGTIYEGDIPTVEAQISGNFGCIMRWADQFRKMKVRTNADTPADAENAVRLGAEGIGLCRTEHMFFEAERIPKFRRMILSDTVEQREAALRRSESPLRRHARVQSHDGPAWLPPQRHLSGNFPYADPRRDRSGHCGQERNEL